MDKPYKIAILTTAQDEPWRIEDSCFADYESLEEKIYMMSRELNYYRTLKDEDGNNIYDNVRLSVTELRCDIKENLLLKVYYNLLGRLVTINDFIDFKIEEDCFED